MAGPTPGQHRAAPWRLVVRLTLEERREGDLKKDEGGGARGAVWDPKVRVPKMARPDFPNGTFFLGGGG